MTELKGDSKNLKQENDSAVASAVYLVTARLCLLPATYKARHWKT